MNENMNLLIIPPHYNSFIKDQVESLSPSIIKIHVAINYNPFTELSNIIPLSGKIEHFRKFTKNNLADYTNLPSNIKITFIPTRYLIPDGNNKSIGKKFFKNVFHWISNYDTKFDLIHSHFTWPYGYVGAHLKMKYGIPFVVTAHGYDIYSLPFKDNEWREKIEYVLNTADHIITVSNSNVAYIQKLETSTPVTVIPNGFKADLFFPRKTLECRKKLNLPLDKKVILTVGNLEPVKGQKYLLEAVQRIIQERKDTLCVIIGSGRLRSGLERQIRSLRLESYIILAGGKPHDEIPLWMNAADLFVLPSLNEGNPTAMFEALGCGVPFIGTKVGGVPEIITSDEYGLLVEPANSKDLAEKILFALDCEWNREAIHIYAQQYTWDTISKKILGVYKQVIR